MELLQCVRYVRLTICRRESGVPAVSIICVANAQLSIVEWVTSVEYGRYRMQLLCRATCARHQVLLRDTGV